MDVAKSTVFIIHGTEASSESNWFPWLKSELEGRGVDVVAPDFPIGSKQNLGSWLSIFDAYHDRINSKTIMVGHSIGPAFILSVLEKLNVRIAAAFLVAPFAEALPLEGYDSIKRANATFIQKSFDWAKIKRNCGKFYVYASDNDPYVPLRVSERVVRNLDARLRIMKGAGHMNMEAGYLRFDELLKDILMQMSMS